MWRLPGDREENLLWNHSVGQSTVNAAVKTPVMVYAWNGNKKVMSCKLNETLVRIAKHKQSLRSISIFSFSCRSVIRTSLGSCHLVHMEVPTLTPLTTLLETLLPMIIACLWVSWPKGPLRMAGHKTPMVTTVPAAILIGRTKHTITSLLTWQSGSSNCSNDLRETIIDTRDSYFALLGVYLNC